MKVLRENLIEIILAAIALGMAVCLIGSGLRLRGNAPSARVVELSPPAAMVSADKK